MPRKKASIWNTRMLLVMQHCIDSGYCKTQKEFLASIGLPDNNIFNIRSGARGFTIEHMISACKKYNINMNWLVGIDATMTRVQSKSALQSLKNAVRAMEAELSKQ